MFTNYIVWKMGSIPNFGHKRHAKLEVKEEFLPYLENLPSDGILGPTPNLPKSSYFQKGELMAKS